MHLGDTAIDRPGIGLHETTTLPLAFTLGACMELCICALKIHPPPQCMSFCVGSFIFFVGAYDLGQESKL